MTEAELREHYLRIERKSDRVAVWLCEVEWDGPHTPTERWGVVAEYPVEIPDADLETACAAWLRSTRYFARCTECREYLATGWMHDDELCQSCAGARYGLVY